VVILFVGGARMTAGGGGLFVFVGLIVGEWGVGFVNLWYDVCAVSTKDYVG
jgi:hypothetical protein